MTMQLVTLASLVGALGNAFTVDRYPDNEQGGTYHPSERPVRRLGVALEPFDGLTEWIAVNQLDALWMHRPWSLDLKQWPADVGVVYHHLPFDEHLTTGYNQRLAAGFAPGSAPEPLGFKQALTADGTLLPQRPIGMLLNTQTRNIAEWERWSVGQFGGYDRVAAGRQEHPGRVAVVGAMNNALIREAARRGAGLYLTGQYRPSAQEAVEETGLTVIAVGHRRSEEWGLRSLANLLREIQPALMVLVGGVS